MGVLTVDPLVLDYVQRKREPGIAGDLTLEEPDTEIRPETEAALSPSEAPPPSAARQGPPTADDLSAMVQKLRANAPAPDFAGLAEAQAKDRDRERAMALGRAGAAAAALMTGRAPDYAGLAPDQKNVRDWLTKQQEQDRVTKLGNEEIRNAAYLSHWLGRGQGKPLSPADDPSNPVSVAARNALKNTAHGADLAKQMGADFDRLSATDVEKINKLKVDKDVKSAETAVTDVDKAEIKKRGGNPDLPQTHGEALALIHSIDQAKAAKERVGAGGASKDDIKELADGIENGNLPPDMKALYKYGAPLKAELNRRGFNLSRASTDWAATNRLINSLNGPQQTRLRQAVDAAYNQLDVVEGLYEEWRKTGLPGGFKSWNRAALGAAKSMPGEAGAKANALDQQMAILVGELGTTLMGGNTPTEMALKEAKNMLASEWNDESFKKAIKQLRIDLKIRQNAISTVQPAGTSAENPYMPAKPEATGHGAEVSTAKAPPPPPGTPSGWVPYVNPKTKEYRYNAPGKKHPDWQEVKP